MATTRECIAHTHTHTHVIAEECVKVLFMTTEHIVERVLVQLHGVSGRARVARGKLEWLSPFGFKWRRQSCERVTTRGIPCGKKLRRVTNDMGSASLCSTIVTMRW